MTCQIHSVPARTGRGFSMIDVLVAIVVLATGLLALAVLQGTLARNGADARARSQIAAYNESVIDRMRFAGFDIVAPSTTFATGATITPATSCTSGYTGTLANVMKNDAKCAQDASGVSNLTTTITASLWCGPGLGGAFTSASSCASGSASYKQINVASTWTDATGQSRSLSFDTTVSQVTVNPTDTTLAGKNFAPAAGYSPVVREADPGNTLGVIPIAISSSQDSAATNPKPVVTNTGTTFSTLTYNRSASDFGGNIITQRVDTKVVQCSCKFGGAVTADGNLGTILAQPYQPTYWDGTTYVTPTKTSSSARPTGLDTNTTQDASCDVCCRDRNDASGNTVLFDNYSNDYAKYQYNSSGVLASTTSGTFVQACRLIRVGGQYATATDAHNNFFGLLATSNCAAESPAAPTGCTSNLAASDTVPSSTTETSYSDFIKHYLYTNFSNLKTNGVPTVLSASPTDGSTPAGLYNGTPYLLNQPSNIDITLPNSVTRWLYARGLYVDHLETKAKQALSNAITNCAGTLESDITNCALPVLPFTTVNMTELANWSVSASGAVIHVSNTAVIGGDESSPKRGNVTVPSTQSGSGNPTANGIATTYVTNSGLTAVSTNQANSNYDTGTSGSVSDQKQFTVKGTSSSSGSSVYMTVTLAQTSNSLAWMTAVSSSNLVPSVSWSGTAQQIGTAASGTANAYSTKQGSNYTWQYAGASSTVPIPVAITNTAPVALTINVQNFNNSDTSGTQTNVTCYNTDGTVNSTNNSLTGATKCYNYAVDTANIMIGTTKVSGATATLMSGTNDGGVHEGAVVTIPATPGISSTTNTIAGATAVTIPFTQTGYTIAAGTCTCKNSSCNGNNQVYTAGTCSN